MPRQLDLEYSEAAYPLMNRAPAGPMRPGERGILRRFGASVISKRADTVISRGKAEGFPSATRRGEYFQSAVSVSNGSEPVSQGVTVTAVGGGSTNTVPGNLLVAGASESYSYDTDGNLISDGPWTYTRDAANLLEAVPSQSTVPTSAVRSLKFEYDTQGRRGSKQIYTYNKSAHVLQGQAKYVWDGWNLVAEFDGADALMRAYSWGTGLSGSMQGAGGVGGLVAVSAGGTIYFPAYDGNGNVVAYVSGASGQASAQHEYGPFREVIRATSSISPAIPIRWSTKYTDLETDLVYYGHRYYNPSTGRWLSRDPLGEIACANVYGFVANGPIDQCDPLGLVSIYYDRTGKEIGRDNTWWPFETKYIEGPHGPKNWNCLRFWEVWKYDRDYLPGAYSGIVEDFEPEMRKFVDRHKKPPGWRPSLLTRWMLLAPDYVKSLPEVLANSPTGRPWDYKQDLDVNKWYIYKNKAYLRDSIGNITWGAIMKSFGWPELLSKKGAGAFQTYEDITNDKFDVAKFLSNIWNFGDDPRDSHAREEGYAF